MKRIIIVGALILAGCSAQYQQAKDIKRLDALSIQQPGEFLRLSSLINPCFDGKVKADTVIRIGKPDTVILAGHSDTIRKKDTVRITKTVTRQVILPEFTTIHDTVEDGRKVVYLTSEVSGCMNAQIIAQTQLKAVSDTARHRLYWLIGILSEIGLVLIYKVYRLVSGGWATGIFKKL